MADQTVSEEGRTPRRHIDKHEAIRHLLHAAIRLLMKQEDPFAIHLIIHSVDKMLIDLAEKLGKELRVDWELYIKDEHQTKFFKRHRAIYNYLKHAKTDFADQLPINDIMMLNVLTLFTCIVNYGKLFSEQTDHMSLFLLFLQTLIPEIIHVDAPARKEILKNIASMQTMTPSRFFETFEENTHMLPRFNAEVTKDLEDIVDFYNLSFSELHAGKTENPRKFQLRHVDVAD